MSTYLEAQNRINNDFLNRSDLTDAVKRSIRAAVHFYERQRMHFNETSTALTTSAGQSYLTLPSNFLVLDRIEITENSSDTALVYMSLDELREMNASRSQSSPTHYTIYNDRIELATIPDSAYDCPCYYIKKLADLSADTDTNAWITDDTENLIVYHATKLMWATVLYNPRNAAVFEALERDAFTAKRSFNEQQRIKAIRATKF